MARRVPGESLAALRDKAQLSTTADDTDPADPDAAAGRSADPAAEPAAPGPLDTGERARVGEMLSRFQAAQRAGRAEVEGDAEGDAEANTDAAERSPDEPRDPPSPSPVREDEP